MSGIERGKRYTVQVTREDDLWVAAVEELDGGITDVERFSDLDTEVRDMIYLLTKEPEGSFDIDWHYVQDEHDYTQAVEELHRREADNARAVAGIERARREIIAKLRAKGLSQRVIAEVIGTSHQRVAQLMAEAS